MAQQVRVDWFFDARVFLELLRKLQKQTFVLGVGIIACLSACKTPVKRKGAMPQKLRAEIVSRRVDNLSDEGRKISLTIQPGNLKWEDQSNEKCKPFSVPHGSTFVVVKGGLTGIEIDFSGKEVQLVNSSSGKEFSAVYAYDTDYGSESVTLKYAGVLDDDRVSGRASIDIEESGKRCRLKFDFNERIQ